MHGWSRQWTGLFRCNMVIMVLWGAAGRINETDENGMVKCVIGKYVILSYAS